jgi:very-short-patch-repair endonuclease
MSGRLVVVRRSANLAGMDSQSAALLTAQQGVFGAHQIYRLGIAPDELRGWVEDGEVVRVRRGAFVDAARWLPAQDDERYRLRVMAVMRSRSQPELASHHSALALWGLPLWHVDRSMVVLSGDVQETTTTSGVRVGPLRGLVASAEVDGLPCLSVADAVVTTASVNVEAGVVAGDAALHGSRCTALDLADSARRLRRGLRGTARLRRALVGLDGKSESPGESRTRLVLSALGLPLETQVEISDASGELVGRVDFLVAGRVVVEFDGAVKYQGVDGASAVVHEKEREDRLRELGYEVVRITWAELAHPEKILARIRAALLRRPG